VHELCYGLSSLRDDYFTPRQLDLIQDLAAVPAELGGIDFHV